MKESNHYSDDMQHRLREAIGPANEVFETAERVHKERQSVSSKMGMQRKRYGSPMGRMALSSGAKVLPLPVLVFPA